MSERVRRVTALTLMTVSVLLLLLMLQPAEQSEDRYALSGRALALPVIEPPDVGIPVNLAGLDELDKLPGVGPVIGQAIIDEREENGAFYYPEDLLSVRGIGEKTLEKLRDLVDMTIDE